MCDVKRHCTDCSDDDSVYSHKHVITKQCAGSYQQIELGKSGCVNDSMMSDNLLHGTNRLFQYFCFWIEEFIEINKRQKHITHILLICLMQCYERAPGLKIFLLNYTVE